MIRKTVERWSFIQNANVDDFIVLANCDNCKGEFAFAVFKSQEQKPVFVHEFWQFELVKFCPCCGARNTQPRPEAHAR